MRCQFYLKKSLEFSFNVISVSHIYKKRASESILRIHLEIQKTTFKY